MATIVFKQRKYHCLQKKNAQTIMVTIIF